MSSSRLIQHLLAPGSLCVAAVAYYLLQTERSQHDLVAQISGWAAVVLGLLLAVFFGCADLVASRRSRRSRCDAL
jgi:hypothetical protein